MGSKEDNSPTRQDISQVMENIAFPDGATVDDRNSIRQKNVEQYLDELDMDDVKDQIISDLPSYPEWEIVDESNL